MLESRLRQGGIPFGISRLRADQLCDKILPDAAPQHGVVARDVLVESAFPEVLQSPAVVRGEAVQASANRSRAATLGKSLDVIRRGSVTLIERTAGDAAACVKLLNDR